MLARSTIVHIHRVGGVWILGNQKRGDIMQLQAENAELKRRLERFVELIKSEICPDFIGLVEHKDLDCRHVCRQCWREAIEKGCQ